MTAFIDQPSVTAGPTFTGKHWSAALLLAVALQAGGAFWLMPAGVSEPIKGGGGVEISLSLAGGLSAGTPDGDPAVLEPVQAPQPQPLPAPRPEPIKPKPVKPKPEPVKPKPVAEAPKPVAEPSKAVATRSAPDDTEQATAAAPSGPQVAGAAGGAAASGQRGPRGMGGSGAGAAAGVRAAQLDYFSLLAATLNKHKRYPYPAKRARHEGTVKLRFVIEKDGRVTRFEIAESSGYPLLDNATIEMLKRASPLPPIPDHLERDRLTVALPIEFSLRRR